MAGRDGKTEKPTAKKRKDAKREGTLPRSQETSSLVAIAAAIEACATTLRFATGSRFVIDGGRSL